MNTPPKYVALINKGIITEEMLSDAIYSVSKRAKHHRDMARKYRETDRNRCYVNRYYYDKYDSAEKSEEKKELYYEQKEVMLNLIEPTAIQTSIYSSSNMEAKSYSIFLFYRTLKHSFHKPVKMRIESETEYERILNSIKEKYIELPVEMLEDNFMVPACEDLSDILSAQFTTKIYNLIKSGNFVYESGISA